MNGKAVEDATRQKVMQTALFQLATGFGRSVLLQAVKKAKKKRQRNGKSDNKKEKRECSINMAAFIRARGWAQLLESTGTVQISLSRRS